MGTEKLPKEKKVRTPKSVESILKGALHLPFAERVKIKNALAESIRLELEEKEGELKAAKELVNGQLH